MSVVWNLVGNNFTHTSGGHTGRSGTHGKTPRHIAWTTDGTGESTFYIDGRMRDGLREGASGPKYGWVLESRSIKPELVEHLKRDHPRYFETYRAIFTHNRELLALDDRFKFCVTSGSWIVDAAVHAKRKRISAISSGKSSCDGHRWRNAFIERHRSRFDLFGNAYRHVARKEMALNDYMFSVAIENGSYESYFTEKILDCFLTGTIPIYYGAPDIDRFFDARGIVPIDDRLDFDQLTEEFYYARMDAIRENFERARRIHTAEDWIYENYREELFDRDAERS